MEDTATSGLVMLPEEMSDRDLAIADATENPESLYRLGHAHELEDVLADLRKQRAMTGSQALKRFEERLLAGRHTQMAKRKRNAP